MTWTTRAWRTHLERQRGEQAASLRLLEGCQQNLKVLEKELAHQEQAREVIRTVGLKTQEALSYHVGDIASLALEAVFDDPYELVLDFVHRRNKTECDLYFLREDNPISPLEASGGGAVDVAAFALRVACWSMEVPRRRPVIILDEPLRFLSRDLQERASIMLKEMSEKLGVQFIIITHEETLTEAADRVFRTRIRKGHTTITQQAQNA